MDKTEQDGLDVSCQCNGSSGVGNVVVRFLGGASRVPQSCAGLPPGSLMLVLTALVCFAIMLRLFHDLTRMCNSVGRSARQLHRGLGELHNALDVLDPNDDVQPVEHRPPRYEDAVARHVVYNSDANLRANVSEPTVTQLGTSVAQQPSRH